MKFKTIWVEGVQKAKNPIKIDLDPMYTSIRGPSDTGKSAIFTKAVLLFTGKYDAYDLETLRNYDSETATVAIELDDGEEYPNNRIMRADITETNVTYTMFKNGEMLKLWQGYNPEIGKIMGLITTGNICVNVLESTKRLFLDTNEDDHTELLEELFSNDIFDKKLSDMEYYMAELNDRYKFVLGKYNKFNSMIRASRLGEIQQLKQAMEVLDILEKEMNLLERLKLELLIQEKRIKQNKLNTLLVSLLHKTYLGDNINMIKRKNQLEIVKKALILVRDERQMSILRDIIICRENRGANASLLEVNKNKLAVLAEANSYNKTIASLQLLRNLTDRHYSIVSDKKSKVEEIKNLVEIKNITEDRIRLSRKIEQSKETVKDLSNAKSEISQFTIINNKVLQQHKMISNINKMELLKEFAIMNATSSMLNKTIDIRRNINKLSEYNTCPLCGTDLEGVKHGEI